MATVGLCPVRRTVGSVCRRRGTGTDGAGRARTGYYPGWYARLRRNGREISRYAGPDRQKAVEVLGACAASTTAENRRATVSGATCNRYLAVLSSILQRAVKLGHLGENPVEKIQRDREASTPLRHHRDATWDGEAPNSTATRSSTTERRLTAA